MKVNEIEELLVRYYDGETNEAEEKELKEFFAQADVPAHLLAEKRLFMQLASQPEPETPEGLESKLSGLIDEWDTHERRTTKIKKHTRIIHLQWVGSIAASLLILFSVGMYLYKPYTPPTPALLPPRHTQRLRRHCSCSRQHLTRECNKWKRCTKPPKKYKRM